jgi:hypothetical protein
MRSVPPVGLKWEKGSVVRNDGGGARGVGDGLAVDELVGVAEHQEAGEDGWGRTVLSPRGLGDVGVDADDDGLAVEDRVRPLVAAGRGDDQRLAGYVVEHISGIM